MSGRRLALRLGAGLAGLTTIASLGLAAPQAASASGFLPTTTTVTSGGAFADVPGIRVPLSAQVALLAPLPLLTKTGVGLLLTPSSSVYFTVSGPGLGAAGIDTPLAPLSHCLVLLSACTASSSIFLSGAPVGIYTVVAHYSGDDLAAASLGAGAFALTSTAPVVVGT
ncbi:MAG TPA: hypothetical protein VHW74_17815 [Mycobacteriales bacterium]|nr:hypothetical protein [Mycobacteriales bacterium]